MSSQTPEQCTHVCNFLFNCGSPLKCTLYSTYPRTQFLRLPSFYLGDHRSIIVVLLSRTILHKVFHKIREVQIMSAPTLPSYIHFHLDHGKLYTSMFLFRFWHQNCVETALSALSAISSALSAYFNNVDKKYHILTCRDKRESYLIVLEQTMFRYAKNVRLASFL